MNDRVRNKIDNDRERAFAIVTRGRRAADFAVVVSVVAMVLLAIAFVGEIAVLTALLAAAVIVTFVFVYFIGTADQDREAIRAAGDIGGEHEKQLRLETERAFRAAMIDALPEPAMYIDAQGKIESANAAARRQFRFVGAEPLLAVVVRRPELVDAVAAARKENAAQIFEFVERDETDRYFSCVAAPLVSPISAGVLVTMHDLTEIKRAEFARVDFLANASHELRTPLTSLSGFIETMRGPARQDPEAWDRFLEIMHGQAERMRRLIADLLSLSRIELNEHRPPDTRADLAAVVAEVGDALQPVAAEKQVKLRISGPSTGVFVTGVRDELSQVAQNLVDNAIKYSSAGDIVEIEVRSGLAREEAASLAGRRWEGAGHMSIATAPAGAPGGAPGRFAMLRVTDSGPGIDRQHLPRLAERFYRVDPGRGLRRGTGLGLAIVKHVVTRHRGAFLVESEVGRGSAFGVILPIGAADAASAEPQAGRAG
jgi:two-component system phosphate regulon sensor histidine kinase PhoR